MELVLVLLVVGLCIWGIKANSTAGKNRRYERSTSRQAPHRHLPPTSRNVASGPENAANDAKQILAWYEQVPPPSWAEEHVSPGDTSASSIVSSGSPDSDAQRQQQEQFRRRQEEERQRLEHWRRRQREEEEQQRRQQEQDRRRREQEDQQRRQQEENQRLWNNNGGY